MDPALKSWHEFKNSTKSNVTYIYECVYKKVLDVKIRSDPELIFAGRTFWDLDPKLWLTRFNLYKLSGTQQPDMNGILIGPTYISVNEIKQQIRNEKMEPLLRQTYVWVVHKYFSLKNIR